MELAWLAGFLGVTVVLILVIVVSAVRVLSLATDAELLASFADRRKQLEQLIDIAKTEMKGESLSPPNSDSPTLRILARYTKVPFILRIESEVRLYVSAAPSLLTCRHKGYAFSNERLTPLVDSLDEPTPSLTAYRHIDGPWYLFREQDS